MKITFILTLFVGLSCLAEDKNCQLRDMRFHPTRDMLVDEGTDSRPGVFNTTIVRNNSKRNQNISNRLAVRLAPNQSLQLSKDETVFQVKSSSEAIHNLPGFIMTTKNREYLFYCGECYVQGRRAQIEDLLNLEHEDGEPFFDVSCAVRPASAIVPASYLQSTDLEQAASEAI
jgi:hypothetical protein